MALTQVQTELIATNAISGTVIADNAITSVHIAQNAILTQHIDDGQVNTDQLAADAVTSAKLADSSVVTANIQDDQVTSDKLANNIQIAGTLGVTGVISPTTHIDMPDSANIKLGTGDDLQIYHDGSNSHIKNTGSLYVASETSGDLYLRSDDDIFIQPQGGEDGIKVIGDGAVELYYDGSKKIETASGGVSVTGTLTTSSHIVLPAASRLYLDGSGNTFIEETAADTMTFTTNNSERLRIASDGKLIIGDTASHTSDLLQIETPASGGGHGIQIRRNDANTDQGIGHIMFGNNTATDLVKIWAKTDGDSNSGDSGALCFSTQATGGNLTERMRITSGGTVAIGTSSPAAYGFVLNQPADDDFYMQIKTPNNRQGSIFFGDSDANYPAAIAYHHNTHKLQFFVGSYDNALTMLGHDSDNSYALGIGTSTPDNPYGLQIEKDNANHTTGLLNLTNSQTGGYGSALEFTSRRSDGGAAYQTAVRINTEGEAAWNSDANASSRLKIYVRKENSLDQALDLQSSGKLRFSGSNGGIQAMKNPTTALSGSDFYDVGVKAAAYRHTVTATDVSNGYADVEHKVYRDVYWGHTIAMFDSSANVVYNGIHSDWATYATRYASGDITRVGLGNDVAAGDYIKMIIFWHGAYG